MTEKLLALDDQFEFVLKVFRQDAGVTLAVGDVLYGGLAPGFISGLYQFNVRLPDAVPDGSQPVVFTTGGQQTQSGTTIAVKR